MRLYLAVAVLMLALVAYTEAQDEQTIEQKLADLGTQMTEMGQNLADKTKTAFEGMHNSEFAVRARSWLDEQFGKVKAKLGEITQ